MKFQTLQEHCKELSIPYEIQHATKGLRKGKWKLSDTEVEEMSVEWLMLQRFKQDGWSGINDEGQAIALIQVILHYEYEALTGQPFYGYSTAEHDFFLNQKNLSVATSS